MALVSLMSRNKHALPCVSTRAPRSSKPFWCFQCPDPAPLISNLAERCPTAANKHECLFHRRRHHTLSYHIISCHMVSCRIMAWARRASSSAENAEWLRKLSVRVWLWTSSWPVAPQLSRVSDPRETRRFRRVLSLRLPIA